VAPEPGRKQKELHMFKVSCRLPVIQLKMQSTGIHDHLPPYTCREKDAAIRHIKRHEITPTK